MYNIKAESVTDACAKLLDQYRKENCPHGYGAGFKATFMDGSSVTIKVTKARVTTEKSKVRRATPKKS